MGAPLVSIIIPTYNGEKFLEKTLASVFSQTYSNYETIVVDDGSVTDGVKKICDGHAGRITYIRQKNKGIGGARNAGIGRASGEYFAFLDDDDVWMPEKLAKQVAYYERLRGEGVSAGLVYTGHEYIDEEGRVLSTYLYKAEGRCYDKLVFIDFIGTPSSVMVARSVLDDVGLFDETLGNSEDYDMWLRIGRKYPVYSLNEILIQYRNRQHSVSKNASIKIANVRHIFGKILEAGEQGRPFDEKKKALLIRYCRRSAALRWKNAAYEELFIRQNAPVFRQYVRKGRETDGLLFGPKVWVYYLLSFVSPPLCKWIKNLRRPRRVDLVQDVAELVFD